MNAWSYIRSFIYGSSIVALAVVIISSGMILAPTIPIGLLLVTSFFVTTQTSMYIGHKYPEIVYSKTPLDPEFTYGYLALATAGAFFLQFSTSWLHFLLAPTSFGTNILPHLDLFLLWLMAGCLMPIFEEVVFRMIAWYQAEKVISWISKITGVPLDLDLKITFAATITGIAFLAAHIPSQGLERTLLLIPITMLLSYLRAKTKGVFTSSVAHVVFNSIAVLMT